MNRTLLTGLLILAPALTPALALADARPNTATRHVETLALGGFFTLYDFLAGPPRVLQPGRAEPPTDREVIQGEAQLVDDVATAEERPARPVTLVAPPVLVSVVTDDGSTLIDTVLPVATDQRPFADATPLPLPATLPLVALALAGAWALQRRTLAVPAQPRSSRRRILPTGDFGSSSRNSTIFGRL